MGSLYQHELELRRLLEIYRYRLKHPEEYSDYTQFELAKLEIANAFLASRGIPSRIENWDAAHGIQNDPRTYFVYIIANPTHQLFKIGISADPNKRRKSFGGGTKLIAFGPGDLEKEKKLHLKFAAHRVGGEWFELDGESLKEAIADVRGGGK